jgi:5,5'-dehydrodivanillate O-demethylase
MLSAEDNLLLTQVGKGTPCGELMRRYWMPVTVAKEISDDKPVKRVRILGEDLVLFRDGKGRLGLIPEHCPHRHASLYFGFIEDDGLRCAYHGWKFNVDGECIEQPYERANGPLMKQACQTSYPVQQLAGLIFAYLGPAPAPLLPRWEMLVRDDGIRTIVVLPPHRCNWLQAQENSLDPTHTYWLHARLFERALKNRPPEDRKPWAADLAYFDRPIESYEFELCREPAWSGIRKVRTYGGDRPQKESGHPAIFPNILVAPQGPKLTMHFRVPVDDENLAIYWLEFQANVDGSKVNQTDEDIPVSWLPDPLQPDGDYRLDHFVYQDQMAWETQGRVFDRTTELIGMGDRGIVMYRNMLKQQIQLVQEGKDPDGVIRDPGLNDMVRLSLNSELNKLAHEMAGAK